MRIILRSFPELYEAYHLFLEDVGIALVRTQIESSDGPLSGENSPAGESLTPILLILSLREQWLISLSSRTKLG